MSIDRQYLELRSAAAAKTAAEAREQAYGATSAAAAYAAIYTASVYAEAAEVEAGMLPDRGGFHWHAGFSYGSVEGTCDGCGEFIPSAVREFGSCYCDDCRRPRGFRKYRHHSADVLQLQADRQFHGSFSYRGEYPV